MNRGSLAMVNRHDPQAGALIRLRGLYPSLKAALRKVADLILSKPVMAIFVSVNQLVVAAEVSEASGACQSPGWAAGPATSASSPRASSA